MNEIDSEPRRLPIAPCACAGAFRRPGPDSPTGGLHRKEAHGRPDKAAAVAELTEEFRSSSRGRADRVPRAHRGPAQGAAPLARRAPTYAVVKNTLTKIAAREAAVEGLDDLLAGPSAIAFVKGDPVEAAKGLRDFAKANPLLVIKGGVMDGKSLTRRRDQEARRPRVARGAAGQAGRRHEGVAVRCGRAVRGAAVPDRSPGRGAAGQGRAGPLDPARRCRYAGRSRGSRAASPRRPPRPTRPRRRRGRDHPRPGRRDEAPRRGQQPTDEARPSPARPRRRGPGRVRARPAPRPAPRPPRAEARSTHPGPLPGLSPDRKERHHGEAQHRRAPRRVQGDDPDRALRVREAVRGDLRRHRRRPGAPSRPPVAAAPRPPAEAEGSRTSSTSSSRPPATRRSRSSRRCAPSPAWA